MSRPPRDPNRELLELATGEGTKQIDVSVNVLTRNDDSRQMQNPPPPRNGTKSVDPHLNRDS
jgi:hypothetical protein